MALQQMIDDNKSVSSDTTLPFNKEAREMMRDMLNTAESALAKIQKTTGFAVSMDEYNEGDENDFFTKQS